ncbi:EamA-like transporter family protein [bacterium BMS3Abin04]|nr:EamA-like transporter family protein [bacterium BMS3Abin04]
MLYLLIVSFIWAFSFGLIKGSLTGLDPNFVSFIRLLISFLIFIPFLKIKNLTHANKIKLIFIGITQYGIMYTAYIFSYQYLKAYEIALFTIFTPFYVTSINDLLEKRFHKLFFLSSFIAVIGTYIIMQNKLGEQNILFGFLLVQLSNICFAFGQVFYKKVMADVKGIKDHQLYALLFLGAVLFTGIASAITTNFSKIAISTNQILILIYLGAIASGLGFFFWNYGARKTNTGSLAVFNNLKIPLAIAVSLVFFSEEANVSRLTIGSVIILFALFLNEKYLTRSLLKGTT